MKIESKRGAGFASLRKLLSNLRDIDSGEMVTNTIARANKYLEGRVKGELRRHRKGTGLALQTAKVVSSSRTIDVTLQSYRRYIKWSFAKGFPASALTRIRKMFAEELEKALKAGVK